MIPFELVEARSLEEALSLLGGDDPAIRPIGGGTALMLMMKAQLFRPTRLVSLRKLGAPFRGLSRDGGIFHVGAMTTFAELERSPDVMLHMPAIVQAMPALANVRVRNVATVGGNLAHADPHLDLPPLWMAMDAEAHVVGVRGERTVAVADLFAGYYETTLASDELVAALRVPLRPAWRSTYVKVTTRARHDWPALGLALSLHIEEGRIRDLRLVLSAALDKATRLAAAEEVLRGAAVDEDALRRAGEAASAEIDIVSDDRGSADYKNHLLRVHLSRAIRSLVAE